MLVHQRRQKFEKKKDPRYTVTVILLKVALNIIGPSLFVLHDEICLLMRVQG
jgi:hypothetical protein